MSGPCSLLPNRKLISEHVLGPNLFLPSENIFGVPSFKIDVYGVLVLQAPNNPSIQTSPIENHLLNWFE